MSISLIHQADIYKQKETLMIMTARQVLECYWDSTAPIDPAVIAKKAGIAVYESKQMEDRLFGVIRRAPETNDVEI